MKHSSTLSAEVDVIPFDMLRNISTHSDVYAYVPSSLNESHSDTSWNDVLNKMMGELSTYDQPVVVVLLLSYIVIFLLSLIGNLLVLVVTVASGGMRSVTNSFLVNLSLADLLGDNSLLLKNKNVQLSSFRKLLLAL